MLKVRYLSSLLIALLLLSPISNAEVSNLRIEDITETEAMMRFDLNPVVDVEVEIKEGDGEYIKLSNTGDGWDSHNYKIHKQHELKPGTRYEMRIKPMGQETWTVKFSTAGEPVDEPDTAPDEDPIDDDGEKVELAKKVELAIDEGTGCQYIRIVPAVAVPSKYEHITHALRGAYVPRISADGVTVMGCSEVK